MKIFNIVKNVFKNDKELVDAISNLEEEKDKICKGKKQVEEENIDLQREIKEIQAKYITILEEKSNRFDAYLKYQHQAEDLADKNRQLKREVAQLKEECRKKELKTYERINTEQPIIE